MTTSGCCRFRRLAVAAVAASILQVAFAAVAAQSGGEGWVATWAVADVGRPQTPPPPAAGGQRPAPFRQFDHQTLRQVVRVSLGGSRVRVVLSNVFGTTPIAIGRAQ